MIASMVIFPVVLVSLPSVVLAQDLAEMPPDVLVERDVVYASVDGFDLLLDIAYPKQTTSPRPAIVQIHGEEDRTVIVNQSELFHEALTKAGVKTEFVRVKNGGHGLRPTPRGTRISPSREELAKLRGEWLKHHLVLGGKQQ